MRIAKHAATRALLAAWQDEDGPVWAYWDTDRAEPRWDLCDEYGEGAMLVSGIDMEDA